MFMVTYMMIRLTDEERLLDITKALHVLTSTIVVFVPSRLCVGSIHASLGFCSAQMAKHPES